MIKYLVMDVDGTLTDGKIYIGHNGEEFKAFNIKDGYGIAHILKEKNIIPIIITGRESEIVKVRCRELGIKEIHQGCMDKKSKLVDIVGTNNISQCAFIGDDMPDYECMHLVKNNGGITGCPSDAIRVIKELSDYTCVNKAGEGAVREFIDWLCE